MVRSAVRLKPDPQLASNAPALFPHYPLSAIRYPLLPLLARILLSSLWGHGIRVGFLTQCDGRHRSCDVRDSAQPVVRDGDDGRPRRAAARGVLGVRAGIQPLASRGRAAD